MMKLNKGGASITTLCYVRLQGGANAGLLLWWCVAVCVCGVWCVMRMSSSGVYVSGDCVWCVCVVDGGGMCVLVW